MYPNKNEFNELLKRFSGRIRDANIASPPRPLFMQVLTERGAIIIY